MNLQAHRLIVNGALARRVCVIDMEKEDDGVQYKSANVTCEWMMCDETVATGLYKVLWPGFNRGRMTRHERERNTAAGADFARFGSIRTLDSLVELSVFYWCWKTTLTKVWNLRLVISEERFVAQTYLTADRKLLERVYGCRAQRGVNDSRWCVGELA